MILIFLLLVIIALFILEGYKEEKKTEQIKYLSSINGITPDEIIQIINETKSEV